MHGSVAGMPGAAVLGSGREVMAGAGAGARARARARARVVGAAGSGAPSAGLEEADSAAVGRRRSPAPAVALGWVALAAAAVAVAGPGYMALNARHPVPIKAATSGLVYVLGDVLSQRVTGGAGTPLDQARAVRSGIIGCTMHGPMSHWWYIALDAFCDAAGLAAAWWVVLAKVCLDQLVWSPTWNGCYVAMTGLMKGTNPRQVALDVRRTCLPLLLKSVKLWGPVHVITYWLVPQGLRLLWVDTVEILWTIMLSTAANDHEGVQ